MNTAHPYYQAVAKILTDNPDIEFKPQYLALRKHEEHTKMCMAKNLAIYRKSANISQAKLAKALGISLSQYKKYESGIDTIRIDLAQKWAIRFCLPVFHILQESEYAEHLPAMSYANDLNYLWFLANSLTDDYFVKLIKLLLQFTDNPELTIEGFNSSGVTPEELHAVLDEIEEQVYVAIAYGLRAARDHFKVSQECIAELLDVSLSTYQEYEKPCQSPRFSILVAARFVITTGLDPLVILGGTRFARVRKMQNTRMKIVKDIIEHIDANLFCQIRPLIDGFAQTVKTVPHAQFIET